ncbi:MAG TPA: hypothetical protein VI362_08295 [Ignavibacteriaceae bacterium]|nr:hypothetical protein [Ignavibacteriaceae bacterium]
MASKQNNKKQSPIGKQKIEKKSSVNPKHKNTVWTAIVLAILLVLFIINNTREIPEEGPYPPNHIPEKVQGN